MIPRASFFTNNKKPLSLDDLKCVLSRAEWKFMQFNCGSSFQATPARLFFGLKISKTFATIETWRERKKFSFDEELNRKNGSGSKSAFSTTFIATKGEDIRRNPPLFLVVDSHGWFLGCQNFCLSPLSWKRRRRFWRSSSPISFLRFVFHFFILQSRTTTKRTCLSFNFVLWGSADSHPNNRQGWSKTCRPCSNRSWTPSSPS